MNARSAQQVYDFFHAQDGLTLVPLSLYFKDSRVKVQVGLCKGKKLYDKRQTSAKQDAQRQIRRAVKEQNQ